MKRPKVIVNCAISVDGKIALASRKQIRISSDEDMIRVFHLRNECDAILVGIGAVLTDDPKLTVKEKFVKNPKQPIRVILDTNARTPQGALVVNDMAKTYIFISEKKSFDNRFGNHVQVIPSKLNDHGSVDLNFVLEFLYSNGITTLLVEGGATIIWSFISQGLFDDLFVYIGSLIIGGKNTPTMADGEGITLNDNVIRLKLNVIQQVGEDVLLHYTPR